MKKYLFTIFLLALTLSGCQLFDNASNDLKMADLRGPVKSVSMQSYASDSTGHILNKDFTWNRIYYAFDHDGIFTNGFIESEDDDTTVVRYQRNESGQITLVQYYLKEWDKWLDTKYTYNDNGTVASYEKETLDGVSDITCQYDGQEQIGERELVTVGEPFIGITRFTILETDNHRNWTRRLAHVSYNISGELSQEYRLDVRTIEYY